MAVLCVHYFRDPRLGNDQFSENELCGHMMTDHV
jgi:hypothetical protein